MSLGMNVVLQNPIEHDPIEQDRIEPVRLDPRPARLRSAARAVARRAAERADALDREGGFPAEDVADAHAAGLLAATLPVALGGAGLDAPEMAPDLADLLTQVGRGSLALGRLYEGHINALALVVRYAEPAIAERLAREACAGHLFGVWNTQPHAGGLGIAEAGAARRSAA